MINDMVTKITALIRTALPLYTRVDGFWTATKDIDAGDRPMAMVYDPSVQSVRMRERQKDQTITFLCLFIRLHKQGAQMRDDLDAVVAAFDADPTLTATVDNARAESYGTAEAQTARTTGAMVIEVKRVD